eukprot:358265_1
MPLPNGYPNIPVVYFLCFIAYLFTILVGVILLYVSLKLGKITKQQSPRSIKISFILCLLFSLSRTICWFISYIPLLITIYKTGNSAKHMTTTFSAATIIGYLSQFCYVVSIAYFLTQKLIDSFKQTLVQAKQFWWNLFFSFYVTIACAFNILYILTDGLDYKYTHTTGIVSWVWVIVSGTYILMILISFIRKWYKYKSLPTGRRGSRYSNNTETTVQQFIAKQTLLISFMVIAMLIYTIGTYMCFYVYHAENINNFITWHWMYFITQSIVLICAFFTFNNAYYEKLIVSCLKCSQKCLQCFIHQSHATYGISKDKTIPLLLSMEQRSLSMQPLLKRNSKAVDAIRCDSEKCESMQSICDLLHNYTGNENDIREYMYSNNYELCDIMNAFNHLLLSHDSTKEFYKIYNQLTYNNHHVNYRKCD